MRHVDPLEIIFVVAIVLIILRPAWLSVAGLAVGRRVGAFGRPERPDTSVSNADAPAEVGPGRGG